MALAGADLHRRRVGAEHARFLARLARLEIKSVHHRARRMALAHVERSEIVPLSLDLRPLGDREAEVGEDFGELVHHLADGMDAAGDGFGGGKRQVEFFGRELALELGRLERGLAARDRIRDRFAQRVDLRRLRSARVGVHRAERLQERRDRA